MEGGNTQKHINEYKILEQRCSNDLEKLRQCFQHGLKPPLFHYERKQMTIVQVNNDLGENDLEVIKNFSYKNSKKTTKQSLFSDNYSSWY
jgi:hypothetical protein